MEDDAINERRRRRLRMALDLFFAGNRSALARELDYRDGAFIRQMLNGSRAVSEKTVRAIEALRPELVGWFDAAEDRHAPQKAYDLEPQAIPLTGNSEFPAIRRVRFKLSAGATGFAVEFMDDDDAPIVFRREWFQRRGFEPGKLFAVRVYNGSMQPGLWEGDTVVVNTADTQPRDGEVYAVNYEGEAVIKRLIRDGGQWWLTSDNPDQRRYPRKSVTEAVFIIGRVVHKQSEHV